MSRISLLDGRALWVVRLVPSLRPILASPKEVIRELSCFGTPPEKIRKRLASWKKSFFPKVGRLTLIRSMSNGIPIYYFSLFRAAISVWESIEKLMRDFLWERVEEGKGCHLVSWDDVGKPMNQGV